ncbi:MAG TPA: energy transducer TonB [Thermoanaerobaculia bacterium]
MKRPGLAFCAFLLLTSPSLLAQASFSRVDQWVAQGRYADAAADLEEIAVEGDATRNDKVLRRVIETARDSLERGELKGEARSAARHVLCLSRAWFPDEELKGTDTPLRIEGDVQRPQIIGRVDPKYTETARRARITGFVIAEAVIDWEGCVRRPRILKGLPMGLDKAAQDAVRHWTFEPATLDDEPVPVFYVLTVNFTLGEKDAGVGNVKFRRDGEERPTITNRPPG